MIHSLKMIIPVLLCWLAPELVYPQVNIEKVRATETETGFATSLSLSLSAKTGNVELTTLSGEARIDYAWRLARSFLLARGDLGWKDDKRFSEEGLLHARYTRLFSGTLGFELFSQFNYDKARLLDARFLAGGGVRVRFVDKEHLSASLGSAAMVEYERYDLPAGARHAREETVGRWSNYFNLKYELSETGSLVWIVYAQPRFDRFEDLRILSEAALMARLHTALSLTLTARVRYDHEPPDGIEELDTAVLSGVSVEF